MAGMLPGVECARRRRFHQSGGSSDSLTVAVHGCTRRSSFCLYTSNHESHHASTSSSSMQRSVLNQAYCDEKLGGAVREAKERLDGRLRTQRKSESTRNKSKESSSRIVDGRATMVAELQTEVFGSKRRGSKRLLGWGKLNWKSSEQVECAVCLDGFKSGESLVHLPCAHRFHSRCLMPWLETNAHCPCCRMGIFVS